MSKPHKIKNYSDKTTFFPAHKRYGKLKILLSLAGVVALVFVGISVYNPLVNFLSGNNQPSPIPEPPEILTPQDSTLEPEPVPQAEIPAEPPLTQKVYGMILPNDIAADPILLEGFIKELDPQINTLVLTVKNNTGQVLFSTSNENAKSWEAVVPNPISIPELTQTLKENSLNLAVRMSIFSDPIAARGDLENNAVMHSSGVVWIDNTLTNGGKPWSTPYSQNVRDYNHSLAKELSDLGVSMIILDYMRFPNDPTSSANFKAKDDRTKAQVLNQFYDELDVLIDTDLTKLAVSINLWTIEQKDGDVNPALFGGDPMALGAKLWTVEIDDLPMDSENVLKELSESTHSKTFIVVTSKAINEKALIGSDKEYILY